MSTFPPYFTLRNDLGLGTEHAPELERAREAIQDALVLISQSRPLLASSIGSRAGIGLFLRLVESSEATIILIDKGMAGAAWATLRTAFECLFYTCALWRNPARWDDFTEAHHKERLTQVHALQKCVPHELSVDAIEKLDALAESRNTHQKWPAYNAAEEAGLKDYYELFYRGCGLAGAHATQRSLDRHLKVDSQRAESTPALDYGPNFDQARTQIAWTLQCLATGMDRLQEQLDMELSIQSLTNSRSPSSKLR